MRDIIRKAKKLYGMDYCIKFLSWESSGKLSQKERWRISIGTNCDANLDSDFADAQNFIY
jgi:hypothetical protein